MDEEKYKKWKKDIAYLKDIDAYDYRDNGMISILLDFVPDEVRKEITMKYATVGSNAIDLRTAMLEVERIIEREKDRVQSRRDRQTKGKISALQEEVAEDLYVWNDEANSGYGGFVLAAKRVRQGEEDEEEAQQERSVRGKVETETGEVQQRSGKAKGGKGKGSKGAESRKCFTCGEEGHLKAQCPLRWYVPKTVFGNWWNSLPFASYKGKGKGKSGGKGSKGKGKGNFWNSPPQMGMMEESEYSQSAYSDYNYEQNNDREWQQIGLLRQVNKRENDIKKIKVQKEISKPLFNFELLRSEEGAENLSIGQSPHGQTVHMIRSPPESSKDDVRRHTCESCKSPQANMTYSVDLKDLVVEKKRNIKKNKVVHFVEGFSKKKNAIVVKDEDEVDHIINEHRRIASLTMASDSIALCTNKVGWKKVSLAIDSGACDNVIDAEELLPDYKVHQTKASTSGMKYASATGEEIPNLGEVMLPMITCEGTKKKMRMQAAAVSRPLASVKKICEAGHMVIFDDQVSYLYNKSTGEVNYLRKESGNYMFDVWIPPNETRDFGRR